MRKKLEIPRFTRTFRIFQDTFEKFKKQCGKMNISHCLVIEALIKKWLRGEIILTSKDFEREH
jgi:hypothetical protein